MSQISRPGAPGRGDVREHAAVTEAMIEVANAEVVVEEEAIAEAAEVPAAEEAAADTTSVVTAPTGPPPSAPPRPRGIVFRSWLRPQLLMRRAHRRPLRRRHLGLGSKAVAEKLREFLFFGVHQMTSAEAFLEFRSCLDTAMAMGLLDSAQLDELRARLAEGEKMIGCYAEANMRMTEGCSLEQELLVIKEQVQPTMASLKVEAQIAEMVRLQPELN
ncbi:unnamed protein product [Prunus brigantina]